MAAAHGGEWRGAAAAPAAWPRAGLLLQMLALCLISLALMLGGHGPAQALKAITLTGDQDRLEITALGEAYEGRGDTLQIETAPASDGATARMAVRATTAGTNPSWIAFALTNPTNKSIELWLTADRYSPIGSGIVWPDLDARRIVAVAHSAGFAPERVRNDRTDIYRLTVERGQTITYVAELASDRFPRIDLWKPLEFEQRQRERQLFNGIMLGITGLLAVFLTAVFAANHKSIFPVAGLVAWCALALLCVDFGFWHKLFQMKPEDNAQYRAAAEAALAASLVIFLAAFLRVNLWSGFARTLFVVWIVGQLAIVGVAVLDPRLAATVARLSLGLVGGLGFVLILVLSLRRLDRALALMPTWLLFLVWLFGAAVTLTGRMSGEFAISGLVAGLVLILVLIGFTVTQYAFRSAEPLLGGAAGGQQMRLVALDRAGVAYWEWNVRRDEMRLDPEIEAALGLAPGELPSGVDQLLAYVHPADRERFRQELLAIRERGGGTLHTGVRLRHADSSYRWLDFEGASVPTSDPRNLRCVGLVRDTTDQKRAQERLLHNAVYDSLTSLPNRELMLDRLTTAMRPRVPGEVRPIAVMIVDVDRFRSVNATFGLVVGDSIILTVSRRLARIVGNEGTLARIGGDQFALFVADQTDARELAAFAERLRLSLRSPIRIAGQEIVLTGSIGIAVHDGSAENARALMRDAEVAMHRAKRLGSDRAEIFSPEMQNERAERLQLERDLAIAIQDRRLKILYQPIVSLSNDELVGFEAVVRWQHPRLGIISPTELGSLAERADLAARLGTLLLTGAVADIARWQQELPRPEHPLFVTISVFSRQLLAPELVQEVRHARSRSVLPAGSLRLSVPEAVVMDNPEQASHVLELLRDVGIELWLDRFGTGYSSLAYLSRFPFDVFRIDRALVEWMAQGERDAALVRSIVAVAHELGRRVAGDGVGTAEDAAFLRAIGCHYAQGFHYGEPMDEDEVLRLLRLMRKSERRMRRRGLVRGQEKRKSGDAGSEPPQIPVQPPTSGPPSGPVAAAPGRGPQGQGPAPPPMPGRAANAGSKPAAADQPPSRPITALPGAMPAPARPQAMPPRPDQRPGPASGPSGTGHSGPISRPTAIDATPGKLGPAPVANGATRPGMPPGAPPPAAPSPGAPSSGPMREAAVFQGTSPQPPPPRTLPPSAASAVPGAAPASGGQPRAPIALPPMTPTAPPAGARPVASPSEPISRPSQPVVAQPGMSPSLAASLARIAGKADAAEARDDGRDGGGRPPPGAPVRPIKAAE